MPDATMTRSAFVTVLLGALLVACPKPAETPRKDDPPAAGGAAASGDTRLPRSTVVATWAGGQLTYGELLDKKSSTFNKLKNKYYQDLHTTEQRELEGIVVEMLVKKAAAAKGQSDEEYMKSIAGDPTVTEQQIVEFYEKNVKSSPQAPPLDAIRDRIRQYLQMSGQQEKMKAEIDRLKTEAQMTVNLPAPESSMAKFDLAGRPFKGNKDAKVTIVEFSDFQCPYCSRATPGVEALLQAYPNDVKVYFLHFPLSFHEKAMPAAIAAECANRQNKFWDLHDKIFANQGSLSEEQTAKFAGEVGLDVAKWTECLKDPTVKAFVSADMQQGEEAGVQGTPSFFINGVQYSQGVPTVEAVKPIVEKKS